MKFLCLSLSILAGLMYLTSCSAKKEVITKPSTIAQKDEAIFEKPVGNELEIKITEIRPGEFRVAIKNISKKPVFCAYSAKKGSDSVYYFPYIIEKSTLEADQFVAISDGGHFAPEMNTIEPTKKIEFDFAEFAYGKYRLRFSYLIDSNAAKIIRDSKPGELTEVLRQQIIDAYLDTVTPVMIVKTPS